MNTEPPPPPPESSPPAPAPLAPPPLPAVSSAVRRWIPEPFEGPVNFGSVVENLLKRPERIIHALGAGNTGVSRLMLLGAALGLAVFGVLLGTYSGGAQLWAAPLKVTLGTLLAVFICLPSLYIFSALGGVDASLPYVVKVMVAAIALCSLLLLGFAPVLWVFSQSTESLPFVGILALVFWLISLSFGLRLLLGFSMVQGARSIDYIKVWMTLFVVVTLQMSTALRPIIGTASTFLPTEKRFFLQHWFEELSPPASAR